MNVYQNHDQDEHALSSRQPLQKKWMALLIGALVMGIVFIIVAALPYLLGNMEKLSRYDGHRTWLLVHIAFAIVPLLIGPFQLWLGFTRPHAKIHRRLGLVYLGTITISCAAAYYLSLNTTVSITFGFGLAGLATAWVVTCSMAMVAVKQRQFVQHQEWMIRSYVVTFGFVTFRIAVLVLAGLKVGTSTDQLNVASWICWALPLLICEALIQGRKRTKQIRG